MARVGRAVMTALIVLGTGVASVTLIASGQGSAATQVRSLPFGASQRTFRIFAPAAGGAIPLVLVLHGAGGSGEDIERVTQEGINRLAEREGFVAVYPDGVSRRWNDGTAVAVTATRGADDVGFVSALIDDLVRTARVDQKRVYVTGFFNGGAMAFRLAREFSVKIAAIAPVAILMPEEQMRMQDPARAIPILLITGTEDFIVPFRGGDAGASYDPKWRALSTAETVRYWVKVNGCQPTPAVSMEPDRDPQDGTRVRRESYSPCRDGSEVILLAVEDGGQHAWPGGGYAAPGWISRDIDANSVIWEAERSVRNAMTPGAERLSTPSRSRHIPAEVKREVWLRDGGQCAFVARNGRRCSERGFLEFHHVEPYSAGGVATTNNIQLRCRAHNGYEAELYLSRRAPGVREKPAP